MMKTAMLLIAAILLVACQTNKLPKPAAPDLNIYPSPQRAAQDLNGALAKAAREHKRVLVVFGANWCGDCQVLNTTFHSNQFAPIIDANYVVVHVNVGEEGKDNQDLAARLGVPLDKGIPGLAVLESDGKVVYAQKNGEFESADKIGMEDVRAFLDKWRPRG
jgi:thiol:disulfide interchange protein